MRYRNPREMIPDSHRYRSVACFCIPVVIVSLRAHQSTFSRPPSSSRTEKQNLSLLLSSLPSTSHFGLAHDQTKRKPMMKIKCYYNSPRTNDARPNKPLCSLLNSVLDLCPTHHYFRTRDNRYTLVTESLTVPRVSCTRETEKWGMGLGRERRTVAKTPKMVKLAASIPLRPCSSHTT